MAPPSVSLFLLPRTPRILFLFFRRGHQNCLTFRHYSVRREEKGREGGREREKTWAKTEEEKPIERDRQPRICGELPPEPYGIIEPEIFRAHRALCLLTFRPIEPNPSSICSCAKRKLPIWAHKSVFGANMTTCQDEEWKKVGWVVCPSFLPFFFSTEKHGAVYHIPEMRCAWTRWWNIRSYRVNFWSRPFSRFAKSEKGSAWFGRQKI